MKFLILAVFAVAAVVADPLTHDEAKLVQDSWHKVHHNEIDILENFFHDHPEHQSRFPAFAGKSLASIKDTAKFATHATRIVSALSEIIELSGNAETRPALKTVLHTLGSDHKRRGIPKESFNDFRSSLFSYLKTHDVGYKGNVEHAWNDAFTNAYAILLDSY